MHIATIRRDTFFIILWGSLCVLGSVCAAPKPTGYDVRNYGALGDGKNLDNMAINKAIEACANNGGGTVIITSGTYLCGSIHIKSHVNLYLDAGAIIIGAPQELNAYDPPEAFEGRAYQDGGHTYFHNSLIWGENIEDVSITGTGMIQGGGLTRQDKEVGEGPIGLGDKTIAIKNSRKVLIRDITIFHGGHFAVILTGCTNITIDNITIDTNRDGINLDCCKNATVSNCRVNSPEDDGICLKSSYSLGKRVVTENVTITNCQVSGFEEGTFLDGTMKPSKSRTGRIKFGTESNGGLRNVTISNCAFRDCRGLALEEVDGGIMEGVTISNLSMMNVDDYPIYITHGRRNRGPDSVTVGIVRDISISNVTAVVADSMSGIQITGIPGHPIENVRLHNIRILYLGGGTAEHAARIFPELDKGYIDSKGIYRNYPEPKRLGVTPAYGLFARHVSNLKMTDIEFANGKEDLRPAITLDDVDGAEVNGLTAQVASNAACVISIANSKNVSVENTKTRGSAKVFVSIGDTLSGNILLKGNDLRNYDSPVQQKVAGQATLIFNIDKK